MRRIVEAIFYLLRGGLPWRMLPPCFPPVSTVRRWFYIWRDTGLWQALNCGSAWKKDPGSGVIGVEKGPLIPVV